MLKTCLSFPKFKRPYHLLFSVSALCLSQEMLQASQIATVDDYLQTDRKRLGRTRNTHLRMSTRLDVQDVSSQQAYDLASGLKRLHQKILQTTGAESDVYFQAQQALRKFQTSVVHLSQDMAIPSLKNLIDHLLPPEVLINTTPSWRESLLVTPILSDNNLGFGVVQERLKELQDVQKYVISAPFQKGLLSDLKAAQQGYQSFIAAMCQLDATQVPQRQAQLASRIAMTGEGLGRYLIPESLAQKMLSKDQHGLSQKALNKQEGGNNNVYAQGGVHFKSTGSVETIKPDQEWAAHAFSMLLFGSGLTPPSMTLCLHQVPFRQFREHMGQLSDEEKQWRHKFSTEVTIPNGNPATYNPLASELFFQRYPLAQKYCHMVGQDTYLQSSESSGEILLGDFLKGVQDKK